MHRHSFCPSYFTFRLQRGSRGDRQREIMSILYKQDYLYTDTKQIDGYEVKEELTKPFLETCDARSPLA